MRPTLLLPLLLVLAWPLAAVEKAAPEATAKDSSATAAVAKAEKAPAKKAKAEKAVKIDMKATEALMKKSDCFACHSVKLKVVGPAYADVAKKYKGQKDAVEQLVKKVKEGGSGHWGVVPMSPHKDLSDADAHAMVH